MVHKANVPRFFGRMSTDQYDPGHEHWYEAMKRGEMPTVYLDGVLQMNAITADVELGLVVRVKCNSVGEPIIRADALVTEVVYGRVDIRLVK